LEENRFAQLLKEPSFTLFQQKLNEITASASLLSYYVADDSLYCVKADNKVLKVAVLNAGEVNTKLTRLINTYFKDGSTAFDNNLKNYFLVSYELYQLVQPFTLPVKQLVFSPDGLLHQLPFEALSTDGKEAFLGGEKQVSYLYSFLQYVNEEKTDNTALPVTVYSFSKQHLGFAALPNSATEEKYLNSNFSSTSSDAVQTTEEMFVQSMQSKSVLHIATHAVAGDSANQPFLVLKNKFYLGQLQYSIAVSPLVVLTACETAAGQLQTGEGVVSLGRAFISKGVKGVVASRWKVDDAVAPVFVKAFYDELNETHSPAAALLEARKKYLQTATNLSQKNPLLWAGFSYMGVEQQIQLKKAGSFNWYWLLLLLILPVMFILKRK
ncbi:MAG: CHAT domain-containing protein, partial [Lacibacter sp.]